MESNEDPQSMFIPPSEEPEKVAPVSQPVKRKAPAAKRRNARPKLPGQRTRSREKLPEPAEEAEVDESLSRLVAVVTRAQQASKSKARAKELLGELTNILGELDDDTFKQIASNGELQDVFQRVSRSSGSKPGEMTFDARGREIGYVPYSYEDFCAMYEMKTWVPRRTDRLEVNGVAIQVYEGFEVTAPICFFTLQEEAINGTAEAQRMQRAVLVEAGVGRSDGVSLEVGWYKESPDELEARYGVDNGKR